MGLLNIIAIPIILFFQQVPVTFTGIEYIYGTDSVKVTARINFELFLRDYQQTIFDDLDLEVLRSFRPFPADLANNYLNSKIIISVNNNQVIGKLLKIEEDERDVLFSLLYRVERKLKSITVRNSLLTGLSSKVQNLTILRSRSYESTTIFTPEHLEETFHLKK
jgi:hypothetical protein